MVIEARKYGKEVRQQLAAALAAQEVGGVTFSGRNSQDNWRTLTSGDDSSDMITQLEVFIGARQLSRQEQRERDVMGKNFSKAQDVYRQLRRAEKLPNDELTMPTPEQREQLVKCIISGMVDNLYINDGWRYQNNGDVRMIGNRSVVAGGDMVVGEPFDLQGKRGVVHLLESVTRVPSVEVLREVAPQLFSEEHVGFITTAGSVVKEIRTQLFNGQDTGKQVLREAEESEARREYIAQKVAEEYRNSKEFQEVQYSLMELRERSRYELPHFNIEDIKQNIDAMIPLGVGTLDEARACIPPLTLDDIISPEKQAEIMAAAPDEYCGFSLTYDDGQPKTDIDTEETDLTTMSDEQLMLPDERDIIVAYDSYSYEPRTLREVKRNQLEKKARQKAEEEAARVREQIAPEVEEVERALEETLEGAYDVGWALKQQAKGLLYASEKQKYTEEWLQQAGAAQQQLIEFRHEQERKATQDEINDNTENEMVSKDALAALMGKFNK